MMIKYPFFDQNKVKIDDVLANKTNEANDVAIAPPEKDSNK